MKSKLGLQHVNLRTVTDLVALFEIKDLFSQPKKVRYLDQLHQKVIKDFNVFGKELID